MKGLVINLFKEPITTKNRRQVHDEEMPECRPDFTVWMHYDFINVREIDNFERYFVSDADEAIIDDKHEGDMQSMHLYFFADHTTREKKPNLMVHAGQKNEKIFYTKEKEYAFACIATLKLNRGLETVSAEDELSIPSLFRKKLNEAVEAFDQELGKYEKDFKYDWYGSLGTEELVLVMNADSIEIFTDILEIIRMERATSGFLSSTYSFVFSNRRQMKEEKEGRLGVGANISLTLNPSGNVNDYIDSIKRKAYKSLKGEDLQARLSDIERELGEKYNIRFYNTIGKYDYCIVVPKETWNFLEEFNKGGLFHGETQAYQNNVFQIKTNWLYEDVGGEQPCCDGEPLVDAGNGDEEVDRYIRSIRDRIIRLKESSPEFLKSAGHLMRAIDLLFYDFRKNMRSVFASEWHEDLYYQFHAFLKLLEYPNEDVATQVMIIEETINSIRQTYVHITQASRMFFEIPSTNLRYTGSFNKVLRAYYGIVKQLLYIAYSIKRSSAQSKLIPIITFEYTTKVNTHIYTQTRQLKEDRLVVFHLPYEALVNIPKYTQYLCHEVFHYITPSDRLVRNKLLADISIFGYYYGFLRYVFRRCLKRRQEELTDKFTDDLLKIYMDLNSDIIKEFIESIYSHIQVMESDGMGREKWFRDQSMKFFMESMEETFFYPQNGKRSVLQTLCGELLQKWREMARTFSEEEAERILSELYDKAQIQPELNTESVVAMFEIKNLFLDFLPEGFEYEMEYLNGILVQESREKGGLIANGMTEAKCDFFTIQMMGMGLEDYLNFQFRFLYEYGVIENVLSQGSQENAVNSSFAVRLGIICDYFSGQPDLKKTEDFNDRIKKCKLTNGESKAEKEDLFRRFLEFVFWSYEHYLHVYYYYRSQILESLFEEELNENTVEESRVRGVFAAKNELLAYCKDYDTESESDKFRINIEMMERFQNQISMKELEKVLQETYIPSVHSKSGRGSIRHKPLLCKGDGKDGGFVLGISNISEYVNEINKISSFLKPRDTNGPDRAGLLWYRGQSDKEHILLPGLLRGWKKERDISPLEYEAALMDMFSSRTIHTLETDTHMFQNTFDWIVHMQHYGMPTNLLDWSENAFVALFFALVQKDDSITDKDAAVYIVNPEYMELARETLIKNTDLDSLQRRLYPIVNLSTNYYEESNEDFIPFGAKADLSQRASKWRNDDTGMSQIWWPKPIVSSLSNVRIRAQYGAFTASNLMAKPNFREDDGGYGYLSIENMQKEFLKKHPNENPFLYKIIIGKESAGGIVEDLKSAGFKTMNVYPEIENVSKAIKKQIETYFAF